MHPLFLSGLPAAPDDARPLDVFDEADGSLLAPVA